MSRGHLGQLIGSLRRLVRPLPGHVETDRELLKRFVAAHDEAAFAELVRRHGAMVLSVCQRLLNDTHAAEDAFQAVFLVLARKAGSVGWQESIGSWLHAVAYRTACKSRTDTSRRRIQERQVSAMSGSDPFSELHWRELRSMLDEELLRLPAKYRQPLVLCYLEGKTNEEAAQQLGWTKGTVSGRLARARDLLHHRLSRRGLTLSAAALAGMLTENTLEAAVSPALVEGIVEAAIPFGVGVTVPGSVTSCSLAEGVLHAMFISRLRWVASWGLALCLLGGSIVLLGRFLPSDRAFAGVLEAAQEKPGEARDRPAGQPDQPRAQAAQEVKPLDNVNRVQVQFSDAQRFGLVCPKLPDPADASKPKRLTRDERGITNNAVVRIEGYEYLYGVEIPGVRFVKENDTVVKGVPIPGRDKDRSWMSIWQSDFGRVRITQSVEIVVGEQTLLYDTVLVQYRIENLDRTPHTVGLRFMLDTCIGSNTGTPFHVPATESKPARVVDKMEVIDRKDMPDFVLALEHHPKDAKLDGTTASIGLKLKGAEPLEKVVMCRWPQNSEARWGGGGGPGDWQFEPMDKNPKLIDSCIVLYWSQVNMKPAERRDLAFTYGLGRVKQAK